MKLAPDWAERMANIDALEAQIQISFDHELQQMGGQVRVTKTYGAVDSLKMDEFYKIMGEFYDG